MNLNGNHNGIIQSLVEGKEGIIAATLKAGRKRAVDVSHALTRKGAAAASAERCNEAVFKLISLAFETDDTGRCNIDVDGRLKWTPWGRDGRYLFGLRATDGDVLRLHCQRLETLESPVPLFTFERQGWYCNVFDYRTSKAAFGYWQAYGLTGSLYRQLSEITSAKRRGGAR